jgi:hypothetical protein
MEESILDVAIHVIFVGLTSIIYQDFLEVVVGVLRCCNGNF